MLLRIYIMNCMCTYFFVFKYEYLLVIVTFLSDYIIYIYIYYNVYVVTLSIGIKIYIALINKTTLDKLNIWM